MRDRPAVALFDAGSPPALAFARSLGRAGVAVHVYSHERLPAARFSSRVTSFQRCPDLDDLDRFVPWLRGELQSARITLVAPTSDTLTLALAEILGEDGVPALLRRSLAPREGLLAALLKDRFAETCRRTGIPTPLTRCPTSRAQAFEMARGMRFPLILKPRTHAATGPGRGRLVASLSDLEARFARAPIPPGRTALLASTPELAWPLLQEAVPDALRQLYSVSGLLGDDGRPLALAASRKLHQWPPRLGIGTAFEACHDPEVLRRGLAAAQAIVGRGLFEVELILDSGTREYLAIDVNPRGYGQMRFEILRGLDLPLLWYESTLASRSLAEIQASDGNILCLHTVPFHVTRWASLLRGPERRSQWADYRALLRRRAISLAGDWRDPLATLVYGARLVKDIPAYARGILGRAARYS
jgi:predicted ATP-grasp superfamily ATP-dependent carboligase